MITGLVALYTGVSVMFTNNCFTDRKFNGYYNYSNQQIVICLNPKNDYKYIELHELGHHVWYKLLSAKQRKAFKKLRNEGRKIDDLNNVSEYARTSVEEDFAETFARIFYKRFQAFYWEKLLGDIANKKINYLKNIMGDFIKKDVLEKLISRLKKNTIKYYVNDF